MSKNNPIVDDLVTLLSLERLEVNLFRGQSRDIGSKQVFGGQVLGQALAAANYTVEDRVVHSLHAYFLRSGDMHAPIIYEVDRQRDGHSFSNRRVVAVQHGRPIFNMAASFKVPEKGLEHQSRIPDVPQPEDLPDRNQENISGSERLPQKMKRFLFHQRPFEFRWVQPPEYIEPKKREASRDLAEQWLTDDGRLAGKFQSIEEQRGRINRHRGDLIDASSVHLHGQGFNTEARAPTCFAGRLRLHGVKALLGCL